MSNLHEAQSAVHVQSKQSKLHIPTKKPATSKKTTEKARDGLVKWQGPNIKTEVVRYVIINLFISIIIELNTTTK